MMVKRMFSVLLLLAILLSVAIVQDVDRPLDCVQDADNLTLKAWGYTALTWAITNEQWQGLTAIESVASIWIGYPEGWDIPGDIRGILEINGDIDGVPMEVWIWASDTSGYYYVFPFANTVPFADSNGQHWGIHPCGGWAINGDEFKGIAIEIKTRVEREVAQ